MDKEVKKFIRRLRSNGLRVEQGKGSHFKVYLDDRLVCTVSASPSDHRWMRNCKQTLAKSGISKSL